MRVKM